MNLIFWIILIALIVEFLIGTVSTVLNMRSLSSTPPRGLEDIYESAGYERSQEYTLANAKFGLRICHAFDDAHLANLILVQKVSYSSGTFPEYPLTRTKTSGFDEVVHGDLGFCGCQLHVVLACDMMLCNYFLHRSFEDSTVPFTSADLLWALQWCLPQMHSIVCETFGKCASVM